MKKMIAILLVLCLLPVTGLAFKLPDINAYSGYQLTKRDEKILLQAIGSSIPVME